MKEMVRYGLVLAIICIVAAGLLAGVNSLTKGKILQQVQSEEEASLKEVMPTGDSFEAIKSDKNILYYKVYDKSKSFIGIAFKASGKGYSGTIETMTGMIKDGTITAIKVLSQNETPGLGARVTGSDFTGQFKDKKDLNEVVAITGATISSKAVMDSVQKKAAELKELIKNER